MQTVRRTLAPLASAEWARDAIALFLAGARDAHAAEQLNGANILASLGLRCVPPHGAAFAPPARRSWGVSLISRPLGGDRGLACNHLAAEVARPIERLVLQE